MPSDTYSTTLGLLLMATGNDNNTWGTNANISVFQILEDAIANALTSAVTGGTLDLSGSAPPLGPSQTRYAALAFTGTLASNQIVQVPNVQKFWFLKNATSGAHTLTLKTPTGSASSAIPQNSGWQVVYCDGSNAIVVWPFNTKQIQMPDGTQALPAYSFLNESGTGWYRAASQDARFAINNVDVLQVTAAGLSVLGGPIISAGNIIKAADGTVVAPGVVFNGEQATGLYRKGAGDVGLSVLGQLRAELTQSAWSWNGATYAGSDLSPTSLAASQNDYNPLSPGIPRTLGTLAGGAGYVDGYYTNVALSGGAGSGLTANIVVSGGIVTAAYIQTPGTAYAVGNTLTTSNANLGGTGSGFSVNVASTLSLADASCLRINATAALSITGLAGGSAGREITVENVGSAAIQFPANSSSSTAANRFANTFNLVPGQSAGLRYDATSSLWRLKNTAVAFSSCAMAAVSPDLLIANDGSTPNTKRNITCSEAILVDASGNGIKFESVSISVDYTALGPGGLDTGTRAISTAYFEWLVSDGVQIKGVASTSSSAATVLSNLSGSGFGNYIYAKRIGANRTNGSSNLFGVKQVGNRARYVVGQAATTILRLMASGVAGTYDIAAPVWVAVSTTGFVPSTASEILVVADANWTGGAGSALELAPNNSYTGFGASTGAPVLALAAGNNVVQVSILLETSNIYWASSAAPGAILCAGWVDAI